MACCDTCPYTPTCEELDDLDDWGEEYDGDLGYCVTPGCNCCGDD